MIDPDQILWFWDRGMDTIDMHKILKIEESEIERQLHVVLDKRRAIVGSLGNHDALTAE